jgi:thymidylate synthase
MNKEHLHPDGRPYTKEEFVEKIKTDKSFAKRFANLGPIYGRQWRSWTKPWWEESELSIASGGVQGGTYYKPKQIDQIQNLISELKTNPDSRRLMVSAWNVGELDQMVLPPCHYGFQVYTRELSLNERGEVFKKTYPDKSVSDFAPGGMEVQSLGHQLTTRYNNAKIPTRAISLMWNQRSVDTFLGLPFNIASYALLLEIIAKQVNMIPDELIGNLGDVHLYKNHIEQAEEQITRTPFELPKLIINSGNENWHLLEVDEIINTFDVDITFKVENYQSHPAIKAPLSN